MDTRPRYRVPDELRETLLDFTIAYLLERPANLPAFGLQFFTKLDQQHRGGGGKKGGPNGAGSTSQDHDDNEGNFMTWV